METEVRTPEQLREERRTRVKNASKPSIQVTPRDSWLAKNKVDISKGPKPPGR